MTSHTTSFVLAVAPSRWFMFLPLFISVVAACHTVYIIATGSYIDKLLQPRKVHNWLMGVMFVIMNLSCVIVNMFVYFVFANSM